MNTSTAAAIKTQFDLHTRLFNNVLEGIDDAGINARPSEHVNNMKWIAGHVLNTRLDGMTRLTGGEASQHYGEQFGRGMSYNPAATYPPIEEMVAQWQDASARISEGITRIPEEVLESKAPAGVPITDETIRGLFSFLVSHEAYHIGQLSLLRKMAGKDAMSYK